MPKILTVVGARPQFIKLGPVSRALRGKAREILVHTGQHYDRNLNAVFFQELRLPRPDYNLGVGSASHAEQTALVALRLEPVLLKEKPDAVLIYGDTNSTLAAALCAAKLKIPVAHVEAGLRGYNRSVPEEINRVVADVLSDVLLCPTATAVKNLGREGIAGKIALVGDVMFDALAQNAALARKSKTLPRLGLRAGGYFLATIHRAENTDDARRLAKLMKALARLSKKAPVVFPAHPRTRKRLKALGWKAPKGMKVIEPASYLAMLALEQGARAVLTDSGGVQKEAYWLGVPCTTLRDPGTPEWPETLRGGWNVFSGVEPARVVKAALRPRPKHARLLPKAGASRRVAAEVLALCRRTR
jgi:UDP-N-acetylglucosamine 2-epimerase